ncbi:hypothetical protein JCM8547_007412 [Rhodosporidiobolus lusitaniae]
MQSTEGRAQPKIQCPYTASSCPLFAPTFSLEDVLSAGSSGGDDAPPIVPPPPRADSPRRPSLVDVYRSITASTTYSAASTSATTLSHDSPSTSQSFSSYYSDFSIAPSPLPHQATSSLARYSVSAQPQQEQQQQQPVSAQSNFSLPPSACLTTLSSASGLGDSLSSHGPPSVGSSSSRRASLASGITLPLPCPSYPSPNVALSYPSPGTAPLPFSYERRRPSAAPSIPAVEEDNSSSHSGLTPFLPPLPLPTPSLGAGPGGIADSSVAYELASLSASGWSGSTKQYFPSSSTLPAESSALRQSASTPKVYTLPPLSATPGGSLLVGSGGSTPAASSSFAAALEGVTEEDSPAFSEAGEARSVEDDEDDDDDDDDGDYVERGGEVGGVRKKRKRASTASAASVEVGSSGAKGGKTVSSKHVVPQAAADSVTPFISKLHHLLSSPQYSDVIRWSGCGKSVLFVHTSTRLLEILSRFFKHSNLQSFARQMNIYGFTRLPIGILLSTLESSPSSPLAQAPPCSAASEYSGFTHPSFFRSDKGAEKCELSKMRPMGPKTEQGRRNLERKMKENGGGRKRRRKSEGKGGGGAGDGEGGEAQ